MYHTPLTTFDAILALYDHKWFDVVRDCRILKSLLRRFGKQRMSYPDVLAAMTDRMAGLWSILVHHPKPLALITSFLFHAGRRFGDHVVVGVPRWASSSGIQAKFASSEAHDTDDMVVCEWIKGYVSVSYDRDIHALLQPSH